MAGVMGSRSKNLMSRQAKYLYREILRNSVKFTYNFREYIKRRARDSFRENQHERDEDKIKHLIQKGQQELEVIKRQALLNQFYHMKSLVVEKNKPKKVQP